MLKMKGHCLCSSIYLYNIYSLSIYLYNIYYLKLNLIYLLGRLLHVSTGICFIIYEQHVLENIMGGLLTLIEGPLTLIEGPLTLFESPLILIEWLLKLAE